MPKRTDIHKILIIGSGPIVIGQACEFDYSGTQAVKALREDGYEVVLVNSNPATIMTDPELANRTYIEPLTVEYLERIIAAERPDALLPTLGGQTGLNVAAQLAERGTLDRYGVQMIGATVEAIRHAEDREAFRNTMAGIGIEVPRSGYARTVEQAQAVAETLGFPCVIRPSYTLGGTGGGVAYHVAEFKEMARRGIELSMISEISVEESVIGWKEFELEVMRDKRHNVVIVCSIENLDPMGVHTGDSITVAPVQTLTDREYQAMRDASIAIIRAIGVETGGSNIQFAVNPEDGRMLAIEMNPRVSRSSALASKATGFPIAKIAAKLAVGYTLDEIPNDITQQTPACFEPTIDYCVVKIPRFAFAKFPGADTSLTTQMKSVGETMAIGRTFKEALQKGLRGLEVGLRGLGGHIGGAGADQSLIRERLVTPRPDRICYVRYAMQAGFTDDEIVRLTHIDPWFIQQVREIVLLENELCEATARGQLDDATRRTELLWAAKQMGFSDAQLAGRWSVPESQVRAWRRESGVEPCYRLVDTCAAEFEAFTPYYYSTYERPPVRRPAAGPEPPAAAREGASTKIMILGGGPNRIGQGIEFDYCCVHASFALKEHGYTTIMVNSNPETVSTDYDTSDVLYFEPVTLEDVLHIVEHEQPNGVIVQFGGQTPLNLAAGLARAGVPIIGTSPAQIDRAEDRDKFRAMLQQMDLRQPANGVATTQDEAVQVAREIGYPCVVRPSYVLGGRAMEIVYDEERLLSYMQHAVGISADRPVLIDRFLEDAVEVDVDLIGDGSVYVIGGILEHIEEAGVHSGDSAMVLPPHTLSGEILAEIRRAVLAMARELGVVGLMNVQLAVRRNQVFVLEVNPRASRTVPFVSKAIGVPLAKLAAQVMAGATLEEAGFTEERIPTYVSVKESVFPFARFSGVDTLLGPEMKSTGEVMGISRTFASAFLKSQLAAGQRLPESGTVFISVKDQDKRVAVSLARGFVRLGFAVVATQGTAKAVQREGIPVEPVYKVHEGRPNVLDRLRNGNVHLIINTPSRTIHRQDEIKIRSLATALGVPCVTTIPGAQATLEGIEALQREEMDVRCLQDHYRQVAPCGMEAKPGGSAQVVG